LVERVISSSARRYVASISDLELLRGNP
jgi:hypothetical protein